MIKIPFLIGKVIIILSKLLNIGGGSTWPGHMALSINPHFISDVLDKSKTKIILIIGTNGKTTTGKLVKSILEEGKKSVFLNQAGANLLNGVASAIISSTSVFGTLKKDYSIFEVDENTERGENMLADGGGILGFQRVHDELKEGNPVIVSISKYTLGQTKFHMVVLTGYEYNENDSISGLYFNEPEALSLEHGKDVFVDIKDFRRDWRKMAIFIRP